MISFTHFLANSFLFFRQKKSLCIYLYQQTSNDHFFILLSLSHSSFYSLSIFPYLFLFVTPLLLFLFLSLSLSLFLSPPSYLSLSISIFLYLCIPQPRYYKSSRHLPRCKALDLQNIKVPSFFLSIYPSNSISLFLSLSLSISLSLSFYLDTSAQLLQE